MLRRGTLEAMLPRCRAKREADLKFAETDCFTRQLPDVELVFQHNDGYAVSKRDAVGYDLVIWINGRIYKSADGRNRAIERRLQN